jgi:hypothetical protein
VSAGQWEAGIRLYSDVLAELRAEPLGLEERTTSFEGRIEKARAAGNEAGVSLPATLGGER